MKRKYFFFVGVICGSSSVKVFNFRLGQRRAAAAMVHGDGAVWCGLRVEFCTGRRAILNSNPRFGGKLSAGNYYSHFASHRISHCIESYRVSSTIFEYYRHRQSTT
jgi:hypothetical protein